MQAGLKSSLIMQQESTSARAWPLASDWYYLGRVRSFDEIQAAVDGLTPDGIVAHVRRYPPARLHHRHAGPEAVGSRELATANTEDTDGSNVYLCCGLCALIHL